MRYQVLHERESYTFTDYFRLNIDVEDLMAYFGYSYRAQSYTLPGVEIPEERLNDLKSRLEESLPYLSLNNETARREFLIAPILLEVVHYTHARIKVEFPLVVNEQLQGTLDYYLQAQSNLLIIEAKNADLQRGFTQLAAELVAIDQWLENDAPLLYGAVSIGNVWQFGVLDRAGKHVTQDLNLYRVPADLEELLGILVAVLRN
jgi:hypothetical protein